MEDLVSRSEVNKNFIIKIKILRSWQVAMNKFNKIRIKTKRHVTNIQSALAKLDSMKS